MAARSHPLIGVTPGHAKPSMARPFCRTAEIVYCDASYLKRVEEAGGIPLLLAHAEDDGYFEVLVDHLDGLLLTGGEDVEPGLYGQELNASGVEVSAVRDEFELKLLAEFLPTGKPVLAICRGIQLVNVFLGGTLVQDLVSEANGAFHVQAVPTEQPAHEIELSETSRLFQVFGSAFIEVNSHHHQALDQVASSLIAVGWSADGMVEAVEDREHPYLVGVQWHPERLRSRMETQSLLFKDFVHRCQEAKCERGG